MITDGQQTTSRAYTPLDKASQPLKDKGVDVWSIGVGKGADKSELEIIASDPKKVIIVQSFKVLKDILDEVQRAACEGKLQSAFLRSSPEGGGGGTRYICLGGEVRPSPSNPDPI